MEANNTAKAMFDDSKAVEDSFRDWLVKEEVRMLLSQIPDTGNRDILLGLLRAAYKAGSGRGQATLGLALIQDLFASRTNKRA